jgi:hypothetical protein
MTTKDQSAAKGSAGIQPRYHDGQHASMGDIVLKNHQGEFRGPENFLVTKMSGASSFVDIVLLRNETMMQHSETLPASELMLLGGSEIRTIPKV